MSLRAAKVFHLLIQAAGVRITDDTEHRIAYAELNEVFHLTLAQLEVVIDELHSTNCKTLWKRSCCEYAAHFFVQPSVEGGARS